MTDDDNTEQVLIIHMDNVLKVIKMFCDEAFKVDPLEYVPEQEAIDMFEHKFSTSGDFNFDSDSYEITEKSLMEYLTELGNLSTDRLLGNIVQKGLLDISHDGNDFCFSLPKNN